MKIEHIVSLFYRHGHVVPIKFSLLVKHPQCLKFKYQFENIEFNTKDKLLLTVKWFVCD